MLSGVPAIWNDFVENSTMLFEVWTSAKQWGIRPSELLHISDEVAAYHLDRAVLLFGTSLEDDIERETRDAKDQKAAEAKARLVLQRWLREPEEEDSDNVARAQAEARAAGRSGFKDPSEMLRKKE
jgi:hypothetical protein